MDNMISSNLNLTTLDRFDGKSQAVRELYRLLLGELEKIGPFQELEKGTSITFENRKAFASVIIRNRSIKLVLRTNHKISSPRIRGMERVAEKSFDHTVFIEMKSDINEELMKWLEDAYQISK